MLIVRNSFRYNTNHFYAKWIQSWGRRQNPLLLHNWTELFVCQKWTVCMPKWTFCMPNWTVCMPKMNCLYYQNELFVCPIEQCMPKWTLYAQVNSLYVQWYCPIISLTQEYASPTLYYNIVSCFYRVVRKRPLIIVQLYLMSNHLKKQQQ